MTADPADGEDRAPLVHPAEMPPPSRPPVESGKSEEDIDLTSRDPPDRLGIIQRQGAVGCRFFADTEGQQFLDQEPGQVQLGRGGSRRQSIRRNPEQLRGPGVGRGMVGVIRNPGDAVHGRLPAVSCQTRRLQCGQVLLGQQPRVLSPRVGDQLIVRARWTTRPAESTMISSQSRMVLSRWAMIRQVQPRRRRWSSTMASVLGSSALVASSRTKRLGSRTSDRAISRR